VADDTGDLIAQSREYYGTPAGVQQQQQADPGGDLVASSRRWYGGANMQGTENGYNTEFFKKMMDQQNAAAENGTLSTFFSQPDATGIVTYDHGGRRNDGTSQFRFGDVFNAGQLVGNLYDSYDAPTADLMMGDLTLSAQEKAHAFEQGGTALHDMVGQARAKTERDVNGAQTSAAFQADVQGRAEGYADHGGDQLTVGAAALGGAALGAGIGSIIPGAGTLAGAAIGAGIGAAVGGITGWLNRDELQQGAARAKALQDMAGEQFGTDAGIATGLSEWGALSMKAISPAQNLVHGLYDQTEGTLGDSKSQWYETSPTGEGRPGWITGVDIAAGFVDAGVQFIAPSGQVMYLASMGANVTGQVGALVTILAVPLLVLATWRSMRCSWAFRAGS
jgi:hypothetical protein